jgi:uncharacterized protein
LKAWPILAIFVIQVILFLAHWFVYSTWIAFWPGLAPAAVADLRGAMFALAFSFVVASLLSFRFANAAVSIVYCIAAVWLGFFNYFFWTSLLVRISWLALHSLRVGANPSMLRPLLAGIFNGIAILAGIYGLINARIIRTRRVIVQLPNLPDTWRGRRAVFLSDLHLGPINGIRFCRRLVKLAARLQPDIVFLPGDVFDGTHADLDRVLTPFRALTPPLGIFFSTGNHEEFTAATRYIEAISRAGIRVLANDSAMIDGVQIAGVLYQDSIHIIRMKAFLESLGLDHGRPCILLNHAPIRLPIVEQAGVSLQLSGHTHGGQFIPFTWITRSVFGPFTSGLHRFRALQVYTSTGAGTWGPPMRVGSSPEMVVLEFE